MTPSQLTHLCAIDAHLERLLEIASKRSSGKWIYNPSGERAILTEAQQRSKNYEAVIWTGDIGGFTEDEDGNYVAACSNNAEAGWESTRKLLNWIFLTKDTLSNTYLVEALLEQWPLETLNQQPQ
jgi:hypothetical protein